MKKCLKLLICVLLVAIMTVGASCTNTDLSKVFPSVEYYEGSTKLQSLTNLDKIQGDEMDSLGLVIVQTPTYDADEVLISNKYRLYNVKTDSFVEGATVDIAVSVESHTGLEYWQDMPLMKFSEGMYALSSVYMSRESESETFKPTSAVMSLFGKNGKAGEVVFTYDDSEPEDFFDLDRGVIYDDSGVRYYVNVKGNLVKESNPFVKIYTYTQSMDARFMLLDYYVDGEDYIIDIFDKEGKHVRCVDLIYRMGLGALVEDEPEVWVVDNYIFFQYVVALSDDAKNFDFQDVVNGKIAKYDLITKRYDVKNDKIKEIDMDFMVRQEMAVLDNCTIVSGYQINDKQIGFVETIQGFDKDGKIALDIQKLVPGAESVYYGEGQLFILANKGISVLKGKKIISRIENVNIGDIFGNSILLWNASGTKVSIFDNEGKLKKTYNKVVDVTHQYYDSSLLLETEDSIIKYNCVTHEETVYANFDGETSIAKISDDGLYVMYMSIGADQEADTDDDYVEIRFLCAGIPNITLKANDDFEIEIVGGYYVYGMTKWEEGEVIFISIYNAETETETVSYYRHEARAEYSE